MNKGYYCLDALLRTCASTTFSAPHSAPSRCLYYGVCLPEVCREFRSEVGADDVLMRKQSVGSNVQVRDHGGPRHAGDADRDGEPKNSSAWWRGRQANLRRRQRPSTRTSHTPTTRSLQGRALSVSECRRASLSMPRSQGASRVL